MNEELGAALLSVLSTIEGRLTEIRDLSRAQHAAGKVLGVEDRILLSNLLPAIADLLGDGIFTTKDIVDDAEHYDSLRAALERSLGSGWQSRLKSLGKLLARADGAVVDGFLLSRVGRGRDGAIWRVSDIGSRRM